MYAARAIFLIASVLLVVNGSVHIISLQLPTNFTPEEQKLLIDLQYRKFTSMENRTFWELNLGVSYGVALITIIAGLQNILIHKRLPTSLFTRALLLNCAGWAVVEAFFIRFVITPPILLWGLVVLLFFTSAIILFINRLKKTTT